jgi:hypothetical protein
VAANVGAVKDLLAASWELWGVALTVLVGLHDQEEDRGQTCRSRRDRQQCFG